MALSAAQLHNARVIEEIARRMGIPPQVALATALVESGLRNSATGDNGSSFGLYQLHQGGELGSHSAQWARNAMHNAETALSVFAHTPHHGLTAGEWAAASQRPADRAAYAQAVNHALAQARQILSRSGHSVGPARGSSRGPSHALTMRRSSFAPAQMPQPISPPPVQFAAVPAANVLQTLEPSPSPPVLGGQQALLSPQQAPHSPLLPEIEALRARLLSRV